MNLIQSPVAHVVKTERKDDDEDKSQDQERPSQAPYLAGAPSYARILGMKTSLTAGSWKAVTPRRNPMFVVLL